jgi:NAD(P)-dependent dehydrogenase (short-subunit alcohol dehydrogenase family)
MRTVIITGSEGLIGSVVSKHFEESGYNVIRVDLSLGVDLTDEDQVKDFFSKNNADSLVNLFGMNHHMDKNVKCVNDFLEIDKNDLNAYHECNVAALFSVCREFIKNNHSDLEIVNFSSLYGITSPKKSIYPTSVKHVGYVTSKHAVTGLTKYIATHFAPRVTANTICPGGVDNEYMDPVFRERYCNHTPMGRMASAKDVCGLVALLCSDGGRYINGTVIPVDGGWTAW